MSFVLKNTTHFYKETLILRFMPAPARSVFCISIIPYFPYIFAMLLPWDAINSPSSLLIYTLYLLISKSLSISPVFISYRVAIYSYCY